MKEPKRKGLHLDDPFHTGQKLKRLRQDHDLTLEKAAAQLGVGKTTLGEYEESVRIPARSFLEKAAVFYKVDLMFFYSTERVSITTNHGNVAAGNVQHQHGTEQALIDRFLAHISERDKRLEDLLRQAIDRLGNSGAEA
jgi:transcriptional regulator with XRE-family HTH domain